MPKRKARRRAARPKRRARRVLKRRKAKRRVKKAKPAKVPASPVTDFLKRKKVEFEVLPQRKTAWKAKDIATSRERSIGSVVKCIVLTDGEHYCCACVPGNRRIKIKKVQRALGTDRLEFVRERDLKKITGHRPGTTAPIGLKKRMTVVFDRTLLNRAKVNISSGKPGFGVELRTAHLMKLADAVVADIKK